jgi:nucleoside-diphosphate-sugar epimerase
LVTGATGFLGGHILTRLLAAGRTVTVVSRTHQPALSARGLRVVIGSLADPATCAEAVRGVETVFHVAARVGVWGRYTDFFQDNVVATRTLLAAVRAAGVRRFVYTSTPSVVYNGLPLSGADESLPLTASCPSPYPLTKALAEREVLAANAPGFATCALRPHLIWGVGDPHLVPRILARAAAGRLRIVGGGQNLVDMVHVENAADAHLLAEQALLPLLPSFINTTSPSTIDTSSEIVAPSSCQSMIDKSLVGSAASGAASGAAEQVVGGAADRAAGRGADQAVGQAGVRSAGPAAGRAYFITNGEPISLWQWIDDLLRALDRPPLPSFRLPSGAAYALGAVCEATWAILRRADEPPMTRFIAAELAKDHWFNITAARRDLGYVPRISMTAGTAELIAALKARSAAKPRL